MVKFQRIYNDLSYPPRCYFAEPPAGQLRFTNTATVNFTTDLLAAVARMFPSKYFSTGGDELNEACYAADTQTQQELNATGKTLEQALSEFTVSTHQALLKQKKTPVVWEGLLLRLIAQGIMTYNAIFCIEMVLAHNVTLSNTTIVMCAPNFTVQNMLY
jgi:hexosaminidase